MNCPALEEIILLFTVADLKNRVFDGCSSLEKIRYTTTKKFNFNDTFFLSNEIPAVLYCVKGSVVDEYAQFFDIAAKYILKTPSVKLISEQGMIMVKWKKITGATGYEVYRLTKKNGNYDLIATIKGIKNVTFTDNNVDTGKKYYYKVVAISKKDSYLNSMYSTKKGITITE